MFEFKAPAWTTSRNLSAQCSVTASMNDGSTKKPCCALARLAVDPTSTLSRKSTRTNYRVSRSWTFVFSPRLFVTCGMIARTELYVCVRMCACAVMCGTCAWVESLDYLRIHSITNTLFSSLWWMYSLSMQPGSRKWPLELEYGTALVKMFCADGDRTRDWCVHSF